MEAKASVPRYIEKLFPKCCKLDDDQYDLLQEGTQKQPYFIHRDGQPVLQMAGLYDVWKTNSEEPMFSFTILTTDSSEKLMW